MIPKIIHYCWFGNGPKPDLVLKCLASWKKHLPAYELMEWNETNFDVNEYQFALEAYQERKYAFVADVCRLHALKKFGGIYLDTDVEFLKPLDSTMLNNIAFTGFEDNLLLSSAIMGSTANGQWMNDLLAHYNGRSFYLSNGALDINPNTEIITAFMKSNKGVAINNTLQQLENYCTIYPSDYFCPKSWKTLKITITPNTYCIHHFAGSWVHSDDFSFMGKLANKLLGKRLAAALSEKYRKLKG